MIVLLEDDASDRELIVRALATDGFHCELIHAVTRNDFEEGIRQQEFRRVNPEVAAATIRALVDGYCLQWLLATDAAPVEVYRDRCRAVLGSYLLR